MLGAELVDLMVDLVEDPDFVVIDAILADLLDSELRLSNDTLSY